MRGQSWEPLRRSLKGYRCLTVSTGNARSASYCPAYQMDLSIACARLYLCVSSGSVLRVLWKWGKGHAISLSVPVDSTDDSQAVPCWSDDLNDERGRKHLAESLAHVRKRTDYDNAIGMAPCCTHCTKGNSSGHTSTWSIFPDGDQDFENVVFSLHCGVLRLNLEPRWFKLSWLKPRYITCGTMVWTVRNAARQLNARPVPAQTYQMVRTPAERQQMPK